MQNPSGEEKIAAVVCDEKYLEAVKSFLRNVKVPHEILPLQSGAQLYSQLRRIHATKRYNCMVNFCSTGPFSSEGLNAAIVSHIAETFQFPYSGCRSKTLEYPLDIVFLMLRYADIPLPRFKIVKESSDIEACCNSLSTPVLVRPVHSLLSNFEKRVDTLDALSASLEETLGDHGDLIVWEVSPNQENAIEVLVQGMKNESERIWPVDPKNTAFVESHLPQLKVYAKHLSTNVLYRYGTAILRFNEDPRKPHAICLENIFLNYPLFLSDSFIQKKFDITALFYDLVTEALHSRPTPLYKVKLHDESEKGFHLCATRDIKKGEIVFEDEARSFAMVTLPHVQKKWTPELKQTFSEYAWPLDSDGHLYAIWEEDPLRWRPINHSCNPNCIFDSPHSLNVIAAHDITAGEDLTIDYATFCDYTMKEFECFCGEARCRKRIYPNEDALKLYGENAWLRRMPKKPNQIDS